MSRQFARDLSRHCEERMRRSNPCLGKRQDGLLRCARNDGSSSISVERDLPMASIRKEIIIDASPDHVWDALRDFGALHTRLVPRFVTDTKLDGDARIVTFANRSVARQVPVDTDGKALRVVYAIV